MASSKLSVCLISFFVACVKYAKLFVTQESVARIDKFPTHLFSFLTNNFSRFSKNERKEAHLARSVSGKEQMEKICVGACLFYMFMTQISTKRYASKRKIYSTNIKSLFAAVELLKQPSERKRVGFCLRLARRSLRSCRRV
jgi:hypothetical protein